MNTLAWDGHARRALIDNKWVLIEGRKYRIRYKQQDGNGQWKVWEVVAEFAGMELAKRDFEIRKIITSGRPLYGTGWIPVDDLISAGEVNLAPTTPRKVGAYERSAA